LNVRAEPSTASETLGVLAANTTVQIVGQDPGRNWWQILYERGAEGKAWVTAQFVETEAGLEVPVIGGGGAESGAGKSAVVIQQLNVRSGPGTNFNALGVLNANDVVNLTGKNRDGAWLQIEFNGGPGGRGWVNAGFVQAEHTEDLPIVTDEGVIVGTSTPMDTPLRFDGAQHEPPTPTVVPASMDFDSADAPLRTILFERAGTQTAIYRGDVSAPDGDPEDWIAFTTFGDFVFVSLQCTGNGALRAEVVGSGTFACNESERMLPVQAGVMNLVHIQAVTASNSLQYIQYTLTVRAGR
jgi:uncharacterized protein YraI